ncbi:MAG: hypothetical protein PVG32_12645 [Anaerolineales bacterium]|jgi:hypothetical protein
MTKLRLKIAGSEVEYEGREKSLNTEIVQFVEAFRKSHNDEVKRDLLALHEDLQGELNALDGGTARLAQLNEEMDRSVRDFYARVESFFESVESMTGLEELFAATKMIQEMQMSFNLQYLMLQNKISHENRQFTMVSNIMKNKHDTAKNSINNIR